MEIELKEIWIDLNQQLHKFILGKVKNEDLTNDILQDVFIKVQLKIDQLKSPSKLTSWIYQITRNTIIDHFRKVEFRQLNIDEVEIPDDLEDDFEFSRLSDCINSKVDGLSGKYKEAISLTTFKNLSQKELSNYLNISYSGAKSRVQRAKEILKEEMLNCPNVEATSTGKLRGFKEE